MSSVAKGVGKIFKPVVKVVKKVAPIALAAAAVYFTAGAALGVAGASGGWGAVAGGLTNSLGLAGSTLGSVLTGAVTQAGYGAAIGAGVSALTGGDISKGALMGAAGGAVTGGVTGGLGFNTDPLASGTGVTGGNAAPAAASPSMTTLAAPTGAVSAPGAPAVSGAPLSTTAGASAGTGGSGIGFGNLFDKGGWMERNQTLVGETLKGAGTAVVQGMRANDAADAEQARHDRYAANYGAGRTTGFGFSTEPTANTTTGNPTPAQQFEGRIASGRRYVYTPGVGMRLVTVA